MRSMKETLTMLQEIRNNTDEQIVDVHESVLHKERELEGKKKVLRGLQDRSASLSETIAFVQSGLQNEGKDSEEKN